VRSKVLDTADIVRDAMLQKSPTIPVQTGSFASWRGRMTFLPLDRHMSVS